MIIENNLMVIDTLSDNIYPCTFKRHEDTIYNGVSNPVLSVQKICFVQFYPDIQRIQWNASLS